MKNAVAQKIAELRHERQWSQDDLANEAELSRLRIIKFEQGVIPSKGSFIKLTRAFKLDPDYFSSLYTPEVVKKAPRGKSRASVEDRKDRQKLFSVLNFPDADREYVLRTIEFCIEKQHAVEMSESMKEIAERKYRR